GCGGIVIFGTGETQLEAFLPGRVYGPLATRVYPPAGYAAYAAPSRLNVSPAVADVMVMVPVATAHVGFIWAVVGATGAASTTTVNAFPTEAHPVALFDTEIVPVYAAAAAPAGTVRTTGVDVRAAFTTFTKPAARAA